MISQIDISKEVEAYRKYLMLANFKKSTVKMYCRTIEKFLIKTKAEVDPTKQLHQSHAQTYLLERLEQNRAWSARSVMDIPIHYLTSNQSSIQQYIGMEKYYKHCQWLKCNH